MRTVCRPRKRLLRFRQQAREVVLSMGTVRIPMVRMAVVKVTDLSSADFLRIRQYAILTSCCLRIHCALQCCRRRISRAAVTCGTVSITFAYADLTSLRWRGTNSTIVKLGSQKVAKSTLQGKELSLNVQVLAAPVLVVINKRCISPSIPFMLLAVR